MLKKIVKAAAAVLLFFLVFFLSDIAGSGIYNWLEREHAPLLFQYATDGKFTDNIYFSEDTETRFGVPGDLRDIEADDSLSGLCGQFLAEQWEVADVLESNPGYMEYLRREGTSLSGLFQFCERLAGLRESVIYACRYILFLLWVFALHLIMRCRPALYFAMGLLCILATCIKLSGELASVFLFGSAANPLIADGLLPSLLEAMLTFLIFDITIASIEKVRLDHKLEPLYLDLPALQCLMVSLAGGSANECDYRSDISRLLPHFHAYAQNGKRSRKKALRLIRAIESLSGPHTNRTFLEAAVELQTLMPPK